jgi:hypothetical protein
VLRATSDATTDPGTHASSDVGRNRTSGDERAAAHQTARHGRAAADAEAGRRPEDPRAVGRAGLDPLTVGAASLRSKSMPIAA